MARAKRSTQHGPEFRAQVVAEAKASTIDQAAKRNGVSRRSVFRWLKEASGDTEMARTVTRKTQLIERDWAETAKAAMRDLLGELVRVVKKAGGENGAVPDGRIHEIAGAVKIVGELGVAKEMFGRGRPNENDRPDAASTEGAAVVPLRGVKGVRAAE